jgi:hypothetical protein
MSNNVRGAQLALNLADNRLYVKGQTSAIQEDDPNFSTHVMSNASLFQVISYDGNLIATGGLTQAGGTISTTCAMPLNNVTNCYRLFFAQAQDPLGPFLLIPSEVGGLSAINTNDGLPNMPSIYNRFIYRPDTGTTELIGGLFYNITAPEPNLAYTTSNKIFQWSDTLLRPICDPVLKPFPQYVEENGQCIPNPSAP